MIEPTDLEAAPSDEYEVDAPTTGPASPSAPAPLPRMWKSEDPGAGDEDRSKSAGPRGRASDDSSPLGKSSGGETGTRRSGGDRRESTSASSSPSPTRRSTRQEVSSRDARKADDSDADSDKKLLEETPEWDTYQTRKRARLFVGAVLCLGVFFIGLFIYRTFIYNPDAIDLTADTGILQPDSTTAPLSLDVEARAMIDRAKEHENAGRRKESIAFLQRAIKAYPKTASAKVAKDALARAQLEQPMFPETPTTASAVESPATENAAPVPAAPADPARGVPATPPAATFDQTRPPDPAKGLVAMNRNVPEPAKAVAPGPVPMPTPSAAIPVPGQPASPPKPSMRPLPRGFRAKVSEGVHSSGWPLAILSENDEATMLLVPEGIFIMGTNGGMAVEAPAHRVQLRSFYIDRDEVTVGRFNRFLEETGYRRMMPRNWTPGEGKEKLDDSRPVTMVSYKDAEAYGDWARKQLPTEAQWEMAGRTTDSRLFPWGSDPIEWSKPRAFRQIDLVGTYPQDTTPSGIRDLAGNVSEWTQDWFDSRYFQQLADTVTNNPVGPARASRSLQRVVKGGSKQWNLSYREATPQEKRFGYVGFRCVLNVESGPSTEAAPAGVPAPRSNRPAVAAPPPF